MGMASFVFWPNLPVFDRYAKFKRHMPALANPRHELFAQAVASGKSASEAYRQSGATGKNADVHAARLMVNDGICKRVAELKAAQSHKSELSRDQAREFLTEVILTPAGKVDEQSRLCQSYKGYAGGSRNSNVGQASGGRPAC